MIIDYLERRNGPVVVGIPWIQEMSAVRDEIYEGPRDKLAFFKREYDVRQQKYKLKYTGGHALVVIGYGEGRVGARKVNYWLLQNSHGLGWGVNGIGKFSMDINDPWGEPLIEKGYVPKKILFPGQQKQKGKRRRDSVPSNSHGNLDKPIAQLMQCKPLSEQEVNLISPILFVFLHIFGSRIGSLSC
jgi:hypothetical protein